jgi:MarR family transcriptional regulator, organic hydroperoxide resistance regulator
MAPTNPVDAATIDALLSLDNQFCFALHAASRMVVRAYRPLLSELDLTYSQYLVMLVLWEWDRAKEPSPTLHALGARLDLDSGTLTPLLRRLEAKGLIARTRARSDERELYVRVTAAGAAMRREACKVPLALIQNSPIPLSEIVSLRDRLKRVRAALAEHAEDSERDDA